MISADHTRRVFLRIGGEFNGAWNGCHPCHYPAGFCKITDLFAARCVHDSLATRGRPGRGHARIENGPYVTEWCRQKMRRPR